MRTPDVFVVTLLVALLSCGSSPIEVDTTGGGTSVATSVASMAASESTADSGTSVGNSDDTSTSADATTSMTTTDELTTMTTFGETSGTVGTTTGETAGTDATDATTTGDSETGGQCTDNCYLTVFATSTGHLGSFGGLDEADEICQTLASAEGLANNGHTFRAWLSGEGKTVEDRFTLDDVNGYELRLPTNVRVAESWDDLTDGTLEHAINVDEKKTLITKLSSMQLVWTNTTLSMGVVGFGSGSCGDWDSMLGDGHVGDVQGVDLSWTDNDAPQFCGAFTARFYCFEQPL